VNDLSDANIKSGSGDLNLEAATISVAGDFDQVATFEGNANYIANKHEINFDVTNFASDRSFTGIENENNLIGTNATREASQVIGFLNDINATEDSTGNGTIPKP